MCMPLLHRQSHRQTLTRPLRVQLARRAARSRRLRQAIFAPVNTTAQPPTIPRLPWRRLLIALVFASVGRTGLATLGAAPATPVDAPSSVNTAYTIIQSLLDNGTQVQEFVTPAGRVFAVSWRGPVLPDLRSILGDYIHIFQSPHRSIPPNRPARRTGQHGTARLGLALQRAHGPLFWPCVCPGLGARRRQYP